MSQIVQDLSVLVSEVDAEGLVLPADSNYTLLAGPSQTIKTLLSRLASDETVRGSSTDHQHADTMPSEISPVTTNECEWNLSSYLLQDSETDFWLSLAEHPFLLNVDSEPADRAENPL